MCEPTHFFIEYVSGMLWYWVCKFDKTKGDKTGQEWMSAEKWVTVYNKHIEVIWLSRENE